MLAACLLAGAGYFTYDKWVKSPDLTVWSFVPQNALFVYESATPLATLQEVKESGIWKNVSALPVFQSLSQKVTYLDTIVGQGAFSTTFKDNPCLISLHTISAESFDFLFVVEIQNLTQHAFLSKVQNGFTKRTREYLDFTITELKQKNGNVLFTFIFYKNYFIGSYSAFLVEDAIRAVEDNHIIPFTERYPELMTVARLERDQGNLYVNLERFPSMIGTIARESSNLNPGRSAYLDLKISDNLINLSGFTFVPEANQFLTPFRQQPGSSFNMLEIVPNETATFLHFNSSDPKKLGKELQAYFLQTDPKVGQLRAKLLDEADFDVSYTFDFLDEEVGIATLESNPERSELLLILEVRDMGEALNFFNSAGERYALARNDTVYLEEFGDYQIRKLPFDGYPYALLGSVAEGFDHTFYLQHRNYLVFSNNLLRLKNLTIGIENENTWGKSLRIRKFMEQINQSANLSYFVNTSRSWNQLTSSLKGSWGTLTRDFQNNFKNIEFLSVQFSAIDDKFYTNISAFQPEVPNGQFPQRADVLKSITMTNELITKPQLIVNHTTRERELVVVDSAYTIYQFSNAFEILWSQELSEGLKSEISQLDYYKNGKLQIVFATGNKMHIIDRNGEYLPGFPMAKLSENPINQFSLIDYDNSKNYRFAIADAKGQVFLTDKDLKALPGWAPKNFDGPLSEPVAHYRIGGKDVFMILQQSGKIHLVNRKAESVNGFPIDLKSPLSSGYFVKESNDLKTSIVSIITANGELIRLSLDGEILNRVQLYKPATSTSFTLLPDIGKSDFVVLRQTENKYELLNENGELLFTKDYFSGKPLYYQYYNLGGDTRLVAMTEPDDSYLYLYDLAGNLVTGRPLSASRAISLWKNGNEYQIYRCVGQNLELISLKF